MSCAPSTTTTPTCSTANYLDLRLRPLTGGRNNRVYAWDSPEGKVCLKLYRTDCEYQT